MNKTLRFASFNELMKFFERPEVDTKQIIKICHESLFVYPLNKQSKAELLETLKKYWAKWGKVNLADRPLFPDISNDDRQR